MALKPMNQSTIPYLFPMPNVEQELTKTAGSKFYLNFDFTNSYWQMNLHRDSQECQSFITYETI